jgi:hypothetical protein
MLDAHRVTAPVRQLEVPKPIRAAGVAAVPKRDEVVDPRGRRMVRVSNRRVEPFAADPAARAIALEQAPHDCGAACAVEVVKAFQDTGPAPASFP